MESGDSITTHGWRSRLRGKVFCVEVESVLAAAPNVFEVAVVAVPDIDLGERVGAVVAPVPGDDLDLDAVATRTHLARHKVPELWYLSSDPLPRNAGGKLRKNVLKRDLDWSAAEFIAQRSRRT